MNDLYKLLEDLSSERLFAHKFDQDDAGEFCYGLKADPEAVDRITEHYLNDKSTGLEILVEATAGALGQIGSALAQLGGDRAGEMLIDLIRKEALNYAESSEEWERLIQKINLDIKEGRA